MDATTEFAKGRLFWAKIVGDKALHNNYEGTAREWSFEFEPEDPSFLKKHGLLDRLKDKEDAKNPDKGQFLVLRKPEFNSNDEKNDPIRIYDADNTEWDDRLIGNGTSADVKLRIVDWGKGKKKSIWVTAIRVTDLVPYESNEFGAMDGGSDEPKRSKSASAKAKAATSKAKQTEDLDDLDDDIPF